MAAMLGTSPPLFLNGFTTGSLNTDFGVARGFPARPKAQVIGFSPISTLAGVSGPQQVPATSNHQHEAGDAAAVMSGGSLSMSFINQASLASSRSLTGRSLSSGHSRGPSIERLKTGSFEVSPVSRSVGFRVTRHKSASPPRMDGAFLPPLNNAETVGSLSRQMGSPSKGGLSKALASSALVRPVIEKAGTPSTSGTTSRSQTLIERMLEEHAAFGEAVVRRALAVARTTLSERALVQALERTCILAELGLDADVLAPGLLHNCLQVPQAVAAGLDAAALAASVDAGVAQRVVAAGKLRGVSDLCQSSVGSMTEEGLERLRTMLLAMTDVHVVLIVLADRLAVLRSGAGDDELVRETRELLLPLANRLGVWKLKTALEDMCMKHEAPEAYAEVRTALRALSGGDAQAAIRAAVADADAVARAAGVTPLDVAGREKNVAGVWKKMVKKGKALTDVHDVRALRLVVGTRADCYTTLAAVHARWAPLPGAGNICKDYICSPKENGYQSLHTVVVGDDGAPLEVQIRTEAMHQVAEYGVAAHWRYKESRGASRQHAEAFHERHVQWARFVLSWQSELNDHKVRVGSQESSSPPPPPPGGPPPPPAVGAGCGCTFPSHQAGCLHGLLAMYPAAVRDTRDRHDTDDTQMVSTAAAAPSSALPTTPPCDSNSDPVYVVVSRPDGTADVHELPPLATAASLLTSLQCEDASSPDMQSLCVNGSHVMPTTRLRMGDVVMLTTGAPPVPTESPQPLRPTVEVASPTSTSRSTQELVAPLGSSPPERLLVDLSPAAVERTRERMKEMMGAVL